MVLTTVTSGRSRFPGMTLLPVHGLPPVTAMTAQIDMTGIGDVA